VTDYGVEIEEHARQFAAGLGVPDFVYRPATTRKGSGDREISDGLLVAGGRGLILQVKSRAPDAASEDTSERAAAWIAKHAAHAVRQANGTRRSLSQDTSRRFVSMRGYERTLPRGDDWPAVVLIDHQNAPAAALADEPNVLYMSMLDWMNIHDRLRSTDAVIEYAHRALASGLRPALGEEFERYRRLAQADAQYAQRPSSLPILPLNRPTAEELFAVRAFDDLVERVADNTNSPWDANSYLPIVELLDRPTNPAARSHRTEDDRHLPLGARRWLTPRLHRARSASGRPHRVHLRRRAKQRTAVRHRRGSDRRDSGLRCASSRASP
jgi:hypothetical protein